MLRLVLFLSLILSSFSNLSANEGDTLSVKEPKFYGAILTYTYKDRLKSQIGFSCKFFNLNDKNKCEIYEIHYRQFDSEDWRKTGRIFQKDMSTLLDQINKTSRKQFNQKMKRKYFKLSSDMGRLCYYGFTLVCPIVPILGVGQILNAPFVGLYHLIGLSTQKSKIRRTFRKMTDPEYAGLPLKAKNHLFYSIKNGLGIKDLSEAH